MPSKTTLALTLALTLVAAAAHAQTGELTTSDRAAALYSTQFTVTADGVPEVSIAVMQEQETIQLTTRGRLRILPGDENGTEILGPAGRTWTMRVEKAKRASVRYWIVVEQVTARDLAAVREARGRWKAKKLGTKMFEVGSIFSFAGTVVDTRKMLIALDQPYDDWEAAKAAAAVATERHGQDCRVHAQMDERATGEVVLEDDRRQFRVTNRDVIWFEAENTGEGILVKNVEYGHGTHRKGRKDRAYEGKMYVAVDKTGKLALVSVVEGESQLRGIVPTEIYPSSHMEALKAQAVVARGELLAKIGTRHLADPFLLCSEVHCQAYSGLEKANARTDQAIRETRGEILFNGDGIVDSVYSACGGGHTEHNEHVWPGTPRQSLRGRFDGPNPPAWMAGRDPDAPMTEDQVSRFLTEKVDAWEARSSKGWSCFRWKKAIAGPDVTKLVSKKYPQVGAVQDLVVQGRGVSGRALALLVRGDRGEVTVERELPIRRLLGGLRSAMFIVSADRDGRGRPIRFRFTGGGYGHGVGMSQVGAIGRAEGGQTYRQILGHYYGGAAPKRLY